MRYNVRILIIGFGSIGKRHYANLMDLGYTDITVYDPHDAAFVDVAVRRLDKLNEENLQNFTAALICNPTHLHVETALMCARAGCHLFIEKPLSHTLDKIAELADLCKQKSLVTLVGCNMRFNPAIKKMKMLVEEGKIGKMHALFFDYGRFLPYQRAGADYKTVYAGKKSAGGGVLLDNIHDLDLLLWFSDFSPVEKMQILTATISDLAIDVEDIALVNIKFANGVVGSIRSDYLEQYKHRGIKIIGAKANLVWGFRENTLWYEMYKDGQEIRERVVLDKDGDGYKEELAYFFSCIEDGVVTFHTIKDAAQELALLQENI